MSAKIGYGILFHHVKYGGRHILFPLYPIKGITDDDEEFIFDDYNNKFQLLNYLGQLNESESLYIFPIDKSTLQEHFKDQDSMHYSDVDLCAGLYWEFAEKYIFILEKNSKNKVACYAMNLKNKEIKRVDVRKNLIGQLDIKQDNQNEEVQAQEEELEPEVDVTSRNENWIDTKKLIKKVTERVVGQEKAAFQLVSTIAKNLKYGSFEGMKSNILLYGPTGCGKTELVRSLAKELNLPLVIEDMTTYTANGYVGDSVKQILRRLYIASDKDMKKAEKGIVVLDEFDKLATTNSKETVNKKDVQEELLKIIEGGKFNINDSNRTPEQLMMDTSNITFILCGAFSKLTMVNKKNAIGFGYGNCDTQVQKQDLKDEDFIHYGLLSELMGRVHTIIPVKNLLKEDFENILNKSSISCLKTYEQALEKIDNIKIVYDDKYQFISQIAQEATKKSAGARGLKEVVDAAFLVATQKIDEENVSDAELVVSADTICDPNHFVLRKVRRDKYELSSRNGENNNKASRES